MKMSEGGKGLLSEYSTKANGDENESSHENRHHQPVFFF